MGPKHPSVTRSQRTKPPGRGRRIWRWIGITFLALILLGVAAVGFAAKYTYDAYKSLPPLKEVDLELTTKVYDANGDEIVSLHGGQNREYAPLRDIPQHVQEAFVSVEDARFWQHYGVDPIRIAGAAWNDVRYLITRQGQLEGASTITQQLARNLYLTQDQKFLRKVQEALIALHLERTYTKEEVLEKYLNTIWFGGSNYGISAASDIFLGKAVKDLTVAEGALLAGMVKNPARYDPRHNLAEAKDRQEVVLDQMVRYGYLQPAARDTAAAQPITVPDEPDRKPGGVNYTGAHFVDYVLNALSEPEEAQRYGIQPLDDDHLFRGGYRIYTTLDPKLQAAAAAAVAKVMNPEYRGIKALAMPADQPQEWIQGAVVMMDPQTGAVRALVGGRTHTRWRELNRATDTPRQPGSTIKPLAAYLPALQYLGLGTGSVVLDAPVKYDAGTGKMWPENFEFEYRGLRPLRFGIEESVNAMAVQLLQQVGLDRSLEMVRNMGISTLVTSGPRSDRNLAMTLGGLTRGVSLLELTSAYGTIANLGVRVEPVVVTKIVNNRGEVIFQSQPARKRVVAEDVAYLMIDLMKGVIQRGTASYYTKGFNGWAAAGKTGTTEKNADAWFMGFTPNLVTGVWNGYDIVDDKHTLPYTGAFEPVMIWNEIMRQAVTQPPADWPRPNTIQTVQVCAHSGLLPGPFCHPDEVRTELYRAGYLPSRQDDLHVPVEVVNVAPPTAKQPVWQRWQPGCAGTPVMQVFHKPYPYERHPTDPNNPRWVPKDVHAFVPTEMCQPQVTVPGKTPKQPGDRPPSLFPGLPGLRILPWPAAPSDESTDGSKTATDGTAPSAAPTPSGTAPSAAPMPSGTAPSAAPMPSGTAPDTAAPAGGGAPGGADGAGGAGRG